MFIESRAILLCSEWKIASYTEDTQPAESSSPQILDSVPTYT